MDVAMTEQELRDRMQAAEAAARAAGRVLLDFQARHGVRAKGHNDFVTEADEAAQAAATAVLLAAFPHDRILGEEQQVGHADADLFGPPTWVVDPLDGTTNFIHGLPIFVVSIGLVAAHLPQVGVIYDPCRAELFSAARGLGAYGQGQPLRVSSTARLSDALLATGFPASMAGQDHLNQAWRYFALRCRGLRRTGSTAYNLAHVAAGHFDAFYAHHLHAWDVAAGLALVEAAGGRVTTRDSQPYRLGSADLLLVSNGIVHDELVQAFRELP
jgi:myo-inositol-1(or 4)-monophosphatase